MRRRIIKQTVLCLSLLIPLQTYGQVPRLETTVNKDVSHNTKKNAPEVSYDNSRNNTNEQKTQQKPEDEANTNFLLALPQKAFNALFGTKDKDKDKILNSERSKQGHTEKTHNTEEQDELYPNFGPYKTSKVSKSKINDADETKHTQHITTEHDNIEHHDEHSTIEPAEKPTRKHYRKGKQNITIGHKKQQNHQIDAGQNQTPLTTHKDNSVQTEDEITEGESTQPTNNKRYKKLNNTTQGHSTQQNNKEQANLNPNVTFEKHNNIFSERYNNIMRNKEKKTKQPTNPESIAPQITAKKTRRDVTAKQQAVLANNEDKPQASTQKQNNAYKSWLASKPEHNEPTKEFVTLPNSIYRKNYSNQNQWLPKSVYPSEYKKLIFQEIKNNNINAVRTLLTKVENLEFRDKNGNTPFLYAISEGNGAIATLLVAKGANTDARNSENKNAYDLAIQNQRLDLLNIIM